MNTDKLIRVLSELEKLKTVERGLNVGSRKESSAEHSWGCMIIADVLIDFVDEPLDRAKVLEYLLYHDLIEIYAGDAKFDNPTEMAEKEKRESEAYQKILTFIPNKKRYSGIVEQYEHRETIEAEFAKAVDCIDACIRNLNQPYTKDSEKFTEALIRDKYMPYVSKFSVTSDLFETLMSELKNQSKI